MLESLTTDRGREERVLETLDGRVAVVTGAASGIGRGLSGRFAREGMKVVLADVEREPLAVAEEELRKDGADVLAVPTDVSSRESVEALADRAHQRYGKVHVLCNNAGVAGGGGGGGVGVWNATDKDWAWVLGVNLMGVVHGLQAFVPRMLAHGEEGHIVNTSSVLGVFTGGGSTYGVSKHAVTRLTEGLYYDLRAAGSKLGVSVLCPGLIATRIVSSFRNRPAELQNDAPPAARDELERRMRAAQARFLERGMPPDEVAGIVVRAIREPRFYVFTHPGAASRVRDRLDAIIDGRAPPSQPPGGFGGAGGGAQE